MRIPLTQGKVAVIDREDADLAELAWYAVAASHGGERWYAEFKPFRQPIIKMHRVILATKLGRSLRKGEVCDHIDRNGLNNRRGNLRAVTNAKNIRNHRRFASNTSGVTGVSWDRWLGRWEAYIWKDGRRIRLGRFKAIEDARHARAEGERMYW